MNGSLRSFVTTLAVLATAACSSSAPTAPHPTTQAQTTAFPTSTGSGLINAEIPLFAVSGADTASGPQGCVFNPAAGHFVCPEQSPQGIAVTTRFTFFDAAGNVQSAFDPATTSKIRTETTARGTMTFGEMTVTVDRIGVMTTSGLGPNATTHTLNGNEHGTITSSLPGSRTMTMSVTGTTSNLVVPVTRGGAPAYPLSGTRVHETTTTMSGTNAPGGLPMTVRRQETFNGTSTVLVEMTIGDMIQQCTYDLATRTTTCGLR